MKPTNQLFEIIKSLTPEEEKKFKSLSSLQQGEKNYIKLYNFIQSQENYDEDKVKNHFKNETFVQHFASEKNQLLHHILKSLRFQRQENNASAKIDEEIKNIQLLFNKSLFNTKAPAIASQGRLLTHQKTILFFRSLSRCFSNSN